MVRVVEVQVLEAFDVRLRFSDGTTRDVNLRPYLRGPVFEPLIENPEPFRAVTVDSELGTIVWPNGADIDPDVLRDGRTPAWMDEPVSAKTGAR